MTNRTEFILCYVTDRRAFSSSDGIAELIARIRAAAEAGIDWIQIREKDLSGRELEKLIAAAILALREIPNSKTRIIVNDRLDIAIAQHADGVHLGEQSLPVSSVREFRDSAGLREKFVIGASCHSMEAAVAAQRDGADYIFFGPVFATPSKVAFGAPQGTAMLAQICSAVRIPVLAIGGITSENVSACRDAGAAGVAAIRMFQESNNMHDVAARLRAGS